MSKQAAKRRAKKEAAASHAALAAVESIAASMSTAGVSAAAAAAIHTGGADDASAATPAAAAAPAAAVANGNPHVLLKEQGNRAFTEKNMAEAIRLFTQAIDECTADPDAAAKATAASVSAAVPSPPPFLASVYSNRSAAFAATFEWQRALADASKCVEIAPHWSKGYYRQGVAHEGLMKFPLAVEAYTAGLREDPRDSVLQKQLEHVNSMIKEMTHVTPEQAPQNPEEDKFETMINWLIAGKSRFPALYLKYYSEEYRGVHALTKVAKDDIVLEVPLSHIMTSDVAKASPIGQALLTSGVELNSTHTYLACYLLQEKNNPNSFWKPYIDVLPQHYRNMPIFFTQQELSYLKGSFAMGKIADRHAELKEEYDNIVKAVPSFSQYKLEEFIWARSVVITRIFGLMINNSKTDGLVPMADMLNHKRPRETSWTYDDSRGAFTITALRGLNQGEQIFDSYGRKCNSRFFVNYGFSLENNADNQCVLWFTLPTTDSHYAMKVRMLGTAKISVQPNQPKRFQIPADYAEDVAKECFSFLRFVHARDSELLLLSSNDKFDVKRIDAISIRNELEVVQDLQIAAETSLSQFDTTIEEDNRILADEKLTNNIRNAVLMRRGEKQVLAYYKGLAEEVKTLVDMPWKDFKKYAAKQRTTGPYDTYINAVIIPLIKADH